LNVGRDEAIVKLFIRIGRSWTTATGWLLRNDIIVTAAHCVYVYNNYDEHATSIQAVADFYRAEQQTRSAKRVVVPREWTESHLGTHSKHDVAFLCLERPFENVQPFAHGTLGGNEPITVAGYPADVQVGGMPGGGMYEMAVVCEAPLGHNTGDSLLRYRGDVQGGKCATLCSCPPSYCFPAWPPLSCEDFS
jgi:hypothetical protein